MMRYSAEELGQIPDPCEVSCDGATDHTSRLQSGPQCHRNFWMTLIERKHKQYPAGHRQVDDCHMHHH